jgi:hypothetical protein
LLYWYCKEAESLSAEVRKRLHNGLDFVLLNELDMKKEQLPLSIVGWREWLSLPELGIEHVKAKVDTGARTSALHAFYVEPFMKEGVKWVRFGIHPVQNDSSLVVECEAPVKDQRTVRDSGGHAESRYVIETIIEIGDISFQAELTLTDRDSMKFRMLLGRTALERRFIVDSAASYQVGKKPHKSKKIKE